METDCDSDQSRKTLTHSQAPARKRNRKGSWGGLKPLALARADATVDDVYFALCSSKLLFVYNSISLL